MKLRSHFPDSFFRFWGWVGVVAVLLAYVLATLGYLAISNPWFHFLNLVGALAIAFSAEHKHFHPSVVLNIVWAIVAVIGLAKSFGIF